MKNHSDQFMAAAKQIALSVEEKEGIAKSLGIRVRKQEDDRLPSMNSDQLLRTANRIRLTPVEKARSKEWILEQIERRQARFSWLQPFKGLTTVAAAVVIVVIGGAGVSFAAENAMPGDLLYPIKINVNEKIEASTKTTEQARVQFSADLAERRLKEAETMVSRSTFNEKNRALLASELKKNIEAVQSGMVTIQSSPSSEDAGMIAINLEATLRAHERVLARMRNGNKANVTEVADLIQNINDARITIESFSLSAALSKNDDNADDVSIAIKHAMNAIDEAEVAIGKKGGVSGLANVRLSAAKENLAHAQSKENTGADAANFARSALRNAKESMVILGTPGGGKGTSFSSSSAASEDQSSDTDDLKFSTNVRMRMTEDRIKAVQQEMAQSSSYSEATDDTTIRMESTVTGAQQLLDIAHQQMDAGDVQNALNTSDTALKHAEDARIDAGVKADAGLGIKLK